MTPRFEPTLYYSTFILGEYDGIHIRKGDIVFDAGANIGDFAIKAAIDVGKEGMVIAAEPNPEIIPYLKKNIEMNNLKNITIVETAISDKIGTAQLSGKGGSAVIFSDSKSAGITISTSTVDEIINELGIPNISVLKMDIEGYEAKALSGQTFLKYVREIAMELHGSKNINDIPKMLFNRGFSISEFDNNCMVFNSLKSIITHPLSFVDAELKTKALAMRGIFHYILSRENPNLPLRDKDKLKIIYAKRK